MEEIEKKLNEHYFNYCSNYVKREFSLVNKTKASILIYEVFAWLLKKQLVDLKTTDVNIKKILRKYLKIFYEKYNSRQGFMFHLDLLEKHKSEINNRITKKLKEKPNYKELFEENIHKSIDNMHKTNNIPFKYYLQAWKEMQLMDKHTNIKSSSETLQKCNNLILLSKIFRIKQQTIVDALNFVYPMKTVGSLKTQLSSCMSMLIDIARNLYDNSLKNNKL